MPLASSSLTQLAYALETVFGVIPTTGNHSRLRMTGETLSYEISKESSEEINATRAVSSMIPVTASASGGLEAEMSYREYDPLFEAVLQGTFNAFGVAGVGATFTATFTATTITASVATSGASIFTALRPGQFFRLVAPTHANNGRILRVSKTVAPTSTVLTVEAATPLAVGTTIANCAVQTSRLTNGTLQRSFTFERQNADIAEYWAYTGMTASSMEISLASGSRTTMSFEFMGRGASRRPTSTGLPGVAAESKSHDIHSGATGPVCMLWVDGAPMVGTYVQAMSMSYDNALRSQEALCNIGAVGIGSGTIMLTGSMEVYFANGDLFDKFISNTNVELVMSTLDNEGNGYVFTIPKANISSLDTNASAKDQDMMLSLEFTGLRDLANADANLRQILFVDRVGVAAT